MAVNVTSGRNFGATPQRYTLGARGLDHDRFSYELGHSGEAEAW